MALFSRQPQRGGGFRSLLILAAVALVGSAGLLGCGRAAGDESGRKVIILGFDGLDYELVEQLVAEGRMPNVARLAERGLLSPLGTAIPPQSPVAWSDFITGTDAGAHGIFDFLHRDPETMLPYLSTSRAVGAERSLKIGKWKFPLAGGDVELLRRGTPFWEVLSDQGVETTIVRIPANFPPSGTATRELSGMGTPDVLGTTGTFSFYTSELFAFDDTDMSGGEVYAVDLWENEVDGTLYGPDNPFLQEEEELALDFKAYLDPVEPLAKLVVGEEERILRVGEWSDWVPLQFEMIPTQTLSAIARFYLKQVEPEFELYVSPLNFDPRNPALPVSHPDSYAAELAEASGLFYTQGMPEDTKSLSEGVFDRHEFLSQAAIAGEEILSQYEDVLDSFDSGLLFYYFGNVDQTSHMLWRTMDPEHPAYDAESDPEFADVIPGLYAKLDAVVGYTLDRIDDNTTLIVMSDHGFTSWRRTFHLNAWLRENGYLRAKDPEREDDPGFFANVDWSQTRAYGLGLNGLYINLKGRERDGIVNPADRDALMAEISQRLLETIDPVTGDPAVTKVYRREETYQDGGAREIGPDLQVGYAKGTRASGDSGLGEVVGEVLSDNSDEWSGDHCMDHEAVPGILATNRPLQLPATRLKDLAAAVLAEFGIEEFPPSG